MASCSEQVQRDGGVDAAGDKDGDLQRRALGLAPVWSEQGLTGTAEGRGFRERRRAAGSDSPAEKQRATGGTSSVSSGRRGRSRICGH